jgi:hypothetical protein
MCLHKVVQRYYPPKEEEGEGYKVVFVSDQDDISGIFFVMHRIPKNTWGKASQQKIKTNFGETYTGGYHIFKKLEDAEYLFYYVAHQMYGTAFAAIVKVKYRKVLTEGLGKTDDEVYSEQVVAAEMYWDGNIIRRKETDNVPQ